MLAGLLTLARASGELAEAEVAVGHEGAHAARLGERQRLAVVGLADDRRHLPVAVAGELLRAAELLQLGVAPWASGAPNSAMMPSPMTWFTVPS